MDATEAKLLDVTRERNDLERERAKESELARENAKAVQDMMSTLQDERRNHKKEKKELQKACHGLKVRLR
jgi:hypothetical protein